MWNALWIFVGGGFRSLARWGASGFIANRLGQTLVLCLVGVWLWHALALELNSMKGP